MDATKEPTKFPVVTLCGSMRFHLRMATAANLFTRNGYIVLAPFVSDFIGDPNKLDDELGSMLDDMHFTKISMSDLVFIVNYAGYIGQSTRNEIDYAHARGIDVAYWYPQYPYVDGPEYRRSVDLSRKLTF